MTRPWIAPRRSRRPAGFTLVELLVVITIIVLVSAVTLPTVIPALTHRQVSEAARILQGAIVGARDAAIRDNAPRGIRLLVDPVFNGLDPATNTYSTAAPLAYNRFIPIETAGDYTTGRVTITLPIGVNYTNYYEGPGGASTLHPTGLRVDEVPFEPSFGAPNERTSWFWNIRIGDKIRFNDAGRNYTVVGPMVTANPELFVNDGMTPPVTAAGLHTDKFGNQYYPEFLYLVNGQDDNVDGFVDNGWDGYDNNYNKLIDEYVEWYNPTTGAAIEQEQWVGTEITSLLLVQPDAFGVRTMPNIKYTITRRPTPVPGSRVVTLPGGVVIDATTGLPGSTYERSRLPIDPKTLYVDILVNSNGQVVPTTEYSSPTASTGFPFYHFWLTERQDVHAATDLWGSTTNPNSSGNPKITFLLPMPEGFYTSPTPLTKVPTLATKGERTLLTLFARTGQTTSNSIENFDVTDINAPFYAAQTGVREAK